MTVINAKNEEGCTVKIEGNAKETMELIASIVHSMALNMGFDYHKILKDTCEILERSEQAGILDKAHMKVERGEENE